MPGKRGYYTNQAIGKTEVWKKQFIDAEWGFSISGKPVVASFKPDLHVAQQPLRYNPHLLLVIGFDPGLGGTAFTFMQEDLHGVLRVLGELGVSGLGIERVIKEHLKPYIRNRFPDARVVIAPDPAAQNRAQTDERSIVDILRREFTVSIETNNRLPKRLDAIDYFATRLTDFGPALQIDPRFCPMLIRALKGGWRWELDPKRAGQHRNADPEKNQYSHYGDSMGYGCRYYHKQNERQLRTLGPTGKVFIPPPTFDGAYHIR